MSETTYYQRNREVILNRARQHYHKNIEVLREINIEINIEIFQKKKKNRKIEYGRNRYPKRLEEAGQES